MRDRSDPPVPITRGAVRPRLDNITSVIKRSGKIVDGADVRLMRFKLNALPNVRRADGLKSITETFRRPDGLAGSFGKSRSFCRVHLLRFGGCADEARFGRRRAAEQTAHLHHCLIAKRSVEPSQLRCLMHREHQGPRQGRWRGIFPVHCGLQRGGYRVRRKSERGAPPVVSASGELTA